MVKRDPLWSMREREREGFYTHEETDCDHEREREGEIFYGHEETNCGHEREREGLIV